MHIHVDFDVIHVPGTTGADPDGSALHSLLDLLNGSLVVALPSDYNNCNGPESVLLRSPAHTPTRRPRSGRSRFWFSSARQSALRSLARFMMLLSAVGLGSTRPPLLRANRGVRMAADAPKQQQPSFKRGSDLLQLGDEVTARQIVNVLGRWSTHEQWDTIGTTQLDGSEPEPFTLLCYLCATQSQCSVTQYG